MGECSAYSSLQVDSQEVKFAALPTSWRPLGADRLSLRGPRVKCQHMAGTVDDSTVNVILGISIINLLLV